MYTGSNAKGDGMGERNRRSRTTPLQEADPAQYGIEIIDAPPVSDADIGALYERAKRRTGIVIPELERFLGAAAARASAHPEHEPEKN